MRDVRRALHIDAFRRSCAVLGEYMLHVGEDGVENWFLGKFFDDCQSEGVGAELEVVDWDYEIRAVEGEIKNISQHERVNHKSEASGSTICARGDIYKVSYFEPNGRGTVAIYLEDLECDKVKHPAFCAYLRKLKCEDLCQVTCEDLEICS